MKSIAALILLIISVTTQAGTFEYNRGVYTDHISEKTYNEDNDLSLIGWKFEESNWGVMYADFVNSFGVDTEAVAFTYNIYDNDILSVDLAGGLMKGYTKGTTGEVLCPFKEEDTCWFVAPRVNLTIVEYENVAAKTSIMAFGNAVIVTVGFEIKF